MYIYIIIDIIIILYYYYREERERVPALHTIAGIGINFTYTPCSRGRVGVRTTISAGPRGTYEVMLEERLLFICIIIVMMVGLRSEVEAMRS